MRDSRLGLPLALSFALLWACGGGDDPEPSGECGNLVVEAGEQCDDGPFGSATCTMMCTFVGPQDEICDDEEDNDLDGDIDCDDDDCDRDDACRPPDEICDDGIDNDGDGAIDCDDSNCAIDRVQCPVASDEICDDDEDNDLDGDTDCDDDDCVGSNLCPEICDDGVDNDGDGWTDCLDTGCAGDRDCPATCGDRRVDPGEECDDGPANSDETPDACRTNCDLPRCGDAVVDSGEDCDLGPDNGSPGTCWLGCVSPPEPIGCGDVALIDIAEHGRSTGTGGFIYAPGSELGGDPVDSLDPPAACSADSAGDVLLYFVPQRTGWYIIDTASAITQVDTITYAWSDSCEGAPAACNDDFGTGTSSRIYVPGSAGDPMLIALDSRGPWGRVQVTAERATNLVGAGEPCTPGRWESVCEPGLVCDESRGVPICVPPAGSCEYPAQLNDAFELVVEPEISFGANTSQYFNLNNATCGGETTPEYVGMLRGDDDLALVEFTIVEPAGARGYIQDSCGVAITEVACDEPGETMTTTIGFGDTLFFVLEGPTSLGGFVSAQLRVTPIRDEGEDCDPTGSRSFCREPFFCDPDAEVCARHLGLSCANPFDLNRFAEPLEDGSGLTWEMDTTDRDDSVASSCGGDAGDLVAVYVPDEDGTARVSALSDRATPSLAASANCGVTDGELACDPGAGGETTIDFPTTAGVPVYIAVEALDASVEGPVTLTLVETPLGEEGDDCDPEGRVSRCADGFTCVELDGRAECRAEPAASCAEPIALAVGTVEQTLELDALHLDDYYSSCGALGGTVVEITPGSSGILVADLSTPTNRRDATLSVRSECAVAGSELQCVRDLEAGRPSIDLPVEAGVPLYLHVNGYAEASLDVRVVPLIGVGGTCDPTGELSRCADGAACVGGECEEAVFGGCESPVSLTRGVGDLYGAGVTFALDTADGEARSIGSCGGAVSADLVGSFVAPSSGELTVTWIADDTRGVIYLQSACGEIASELGCDVADAARSPAAVSTEMERGETVYVWLDGVATGGSSPSTPGAVRVRFDSDAVDQCSNELRDPAEADFDCGGPHCEPCAVGRACYYDGDCVTGTCLEGECSLLETCGNRVLDGDETDVDCGGPCAPCAAGLECDEDADCYSNICDAGVCLRSSCTDGVSGGSETGVDCGGPICDPCPIGEGCEDPLDCASLSCSPTSSLCIEPDCDDGLLNGDEITVDCGGICGGEPCTIECGPGSDWIDANLYWTDFDNYLVIGVDGITPFTLSESSSYDPLSPDCGFGIGESGEAVHRFEVPWDGNYLFTTVVPGVTTTANTVVYLRDHSCLPTAPELVCNDDQDEGEQRAAVRYTLSEGDVVFVIVDGFGPADSGETYALLISPPAPPSE